MGQKEWWTFGRAEGSLDMVVWRGIGLEFMGEARGRRVVEARTSEGPSELSPCDPGRSVDGWDHGGIRPLVKLWWLAAVGVDVVVKPWCCSVSVSCVQPSIVVVGVSGAVGGVGVVEEVVEMFSFNVGEVVDCQIGVWGVDQKLAGDPFQSASLVVVCSAKDAVVPVAEVVLLLVKDV